MSLPAVSSAFDSDSASPLRPTAALATLDDMLWSIVPKERTAQKARLSKLIPSLIGGLRAGCATRRRDARTGPGVSESMWRVPEPEQSPDS